MANSAAVFYDGLTARRRVVTLTLEARELVIVEDDTMLARWAFAALREQDAPTGCLRLAAAGAPELARLEIADPALAAEILRRCPAIGQAQRANRTAKAQIVAWSVAAAISLVLTAVYLVPLAADRVTPLIPQSLERRLGDVVDNQVRSMFGGTPCATSDGAAALRAMQSRLMAGAPPGLSIEVAVLASPIANAVALPGGRIYLLQGLIARAANAEEVAGVLAHEMGHIAQRDGLRRLLQSSGSSFLIGLLFGDVVGGGALITLGQALVNSAYSREQESAADGFAADLFLRIGQSPKPLGTILARLKETQKGGLNSLPILQDHPLSEERLAALSTREPTTPTAPLLSEAEWQALKTICPAAPIKKQE